MASVGLMAQQQNADWQRWHYLSEEEMNTPVRAINFTETPPPTGEPRFVAEFEPMQGVMIRYPLGIPENLVVMLSNNCHVYCIVAGYDQSSAQSAFQSAGVNMANLTFVTAQSDSYWVRDYGPWYIFEDRHPAIVDNVYNRPRPNDDNMSGVFANFWSIPMYGMNLQHTGGNMMEDGRGHGVSDDLVVSENGYNETNVRQKMHDYLGIDPYHITIDPQGDYIAHVDCWGKYLAPDKILIARLPQNNPRYQYYEQVANYFETTNCCWGYPYRVYRVDEPGGSILAPYTNSLILNKSVYVPLGDNSNYNQQALAVYQEAMPGYEIVGVPYNSYWGSGWQNTDALHCRARGVMDFNMLFVDHRDVVFGEQPWQPSIPIVSKFIPYSGTALKQDSLLVYYSIDGGAYQTAHMTATGNPDEYVGYITGYESGSSVDYYVFGADESDHRYTQPVFGNLDPHHFTVGEYQPTGVLAIEPDTIQFYHMGEEQSFTLVNGTAEAVLISEINPEEGSMLNILEPDLPYTLEPGRSVTVTVGLPIVPLKEDYLFFDIQIVTNIGQKKVTAMIATVALDMGLYIPGAPVVELTIDHPIDEPYFVNGNYGTEAPIDIYSITEAENPTGVPYLFIDPSHDLPYTLAVGESFHFALVPNSVVCKGVVTTTVTVLSNDRTLEYGVTIDENLLTSVVELSAETMLYPNPTTGMFTVEGKDVARVVVYNLMGQKVIETEKGGRETTIDATNWNKGIYLVNIISQNGVVETRKLVVN